MSTTVTFAGTWPRRPSYSTPARTSRSSVAACWSTGAYRTTRRSGSTTSPPPTTSRSSARPPPTFTTAADPATRSSSTASSAPRAGRTRRPARSAPRTSWSLTTASARSASRSGTSPRASSALPARPTQLTTREVPMDLVAQSPDELLAAVPHVLGFKLFWTSDRAGTTNENVNHECPQRDRLSRPACAVGSVVPVPLPAGLMLFGRCGALRKSRPWGTSRCGWPS